MSDFIPDTPLTKALIRMRRRERRQRRVDIAANVVLATLAGVSAAFILGCIINPAAVAALIGITP